MACQKRKALNLVQKYCGLLPPYVASLKLYFAFLIVCSPFLSERIGRIVLYTRIIRGFIGTIGYSTITLGE